MGSTPRFDHGSVCQNGCLRQVGSEVDHEERFDQVSVGADGGCFDAVDGDDCAGLEDFDGLQESVSFSLGAEDRNGDDDHLGLRGETGMPEEKVIEHAEVPGTSVILPRDMG